MELGQIFNMSAGAVGVLGFVCQKSVEEVLKQYFSRKSKKEISRLFWIVLIVAVAIPLSMGYLASNHGNNMQTGTPAPMNMVEPTK